MAHRFLEAEGILQVRADRQKHLPYGLQGGRSGTPSRNILNLGGDTRVLLGQIDEAIDRLSGGLDRDPDLPDNEPTLSDDPLDHRELLSPDSDELEEIEEEDEESLDDDEGPLPDDETDQAVWADDQKPN